MTSSYYPTPPGTGHPLATASEKADMDWMARFKKPSTKWMKILMQHSTSKPKRYGRAPNPTGILHALQVTREGVNFRVVLPLPNSFLPGDGWNVTGMGFGPDEEASKELAIQEVLGKLLFKGPHHVRLLDCDWEIPKEDLVQQVAARVAARSGHDGMGPRPDGPMSGQPSAATSSNFQEPTHGEDRDGARRELIGFIIRHHWRVSKKNPKPQELKKGKKVWIPELDRLFKPHSLKQWLMESTEFKVVEEERGGWSFTFADARAVGMESEQPPKAAPLPFKAPHVKAAAPPKKAPPQRPPSPETEEKKAQPPRPHPATEENHPKACDLALRFPPPYINNCRIQPGVTNLEEYPTSKPPALCHPAGPTPAIGRTFPPKLPQYIPFLRLPIGIPTKPPPPVPPQGPTADYGEHMLVDEGHPGHDKWSGPLDPSDPDISQVAPATPPGQGCKLDLSIPAKLDDSGYGPSNYGSSPSTFLNSNYHLEGGQLQFSI